MFNSIQSGAGLVLTSNQQPLPHTSGAMYWDGASKSFNIIDGFGFKNSISTQPVTVSLDAWAQVAINWAHEKIAEERQLNELCAKHPGLKDVKEKYELMLALIKESE